MVTIRKAEDRGHFDHGWLETYHTFSFGEYHDPDQMGFRALRVINEDRVKPGQGFPTHYHRDMEIITYILEGAIEHRDSMGNGSVIRLGEVQRMSAGTGVTHSEYNPSRTDLLHLLQIWILPSKKGLRPSYEQRSYPEKERRRKLCLIASPNGRGTSVMIHQNAHLYASLLDPGDEIDYRLSADRHAWVQLTRGAIVLNSHLLKEGDGAGISGEARFTLVGKKETELLLFDLA